MQTYRLRMLVAITFLVSACGASATHPDADHDRAGECAAAQFVPCSTFDECTKRDGKFIMPRPCFDHAAEACAAAACSNGCDIRPGGLGAPSMVLCSLSAQFSSHMKICGGFSGWGCPENMRCTYTPEAARANDATGTCEPIAP